ncbi:transcriptional regulator NrdR [Alicyclobacillus macrosporangiidus]|jgi:transcriptional repressor NrdR|uniref:Transcriptional repressor NrdR n=1 Tax=Alicyclobacillus macrosporangiidus TaxID=392015 RepID=A0A1I7JC31_9BACL|nr:transcriptional regulator NrdR [Alicyclobacillus macrosporangiidus]MCL6600478.1 transcriptional regulator NrdR [Alicyclobacillus macrosporangiidus]SFU82742.1 transcriptional repressor NrdR [Alicyclobacillus macrosporangiidus]
MRCPYCETDNSRVIESRASEDGTTIRRRRECTNPSCGRRFTTYERIEQRPLMVVKKDNKREEFSYEKLYRGLMKACEKRPISAEQVEQVVERIDRRLRLEFEREVPSSVIGERVMEELRALDGVAYVRFASVYRQFRDVETLAQEVLSLLQETAGRTKPGN